MQTPMPQPPIPNEFIGIRRASTPIFYQPLWACGTTDLYQVIRVRTDFFSLVVMRDCPELHKMLMKLNALTILWRKSATMRGEPFWWHGESDGQHHFNLDMASLQIFTEAFGIYIHHENASPFPYWIKYNADPVELTRIDLAIGSRTTALAAWQTKFSQSHIHERLLMFRTEDDRALARLCL